MATCNDRVEARLAQHDSEPMPSVEVPDFYERNSELRIEIIEGIAREKQIITLAGAYGIGKSPIMCDLTVAMVHGIPWCGRKISARPVIVFDFESPAPMYKQNLLNSAERYGVNPPRVPEELDAYLMSDATSEPTTAKLLEALAGGSTEMLRLIDEALQTKPTALVVIDPVELMFPMDKLKGWHVLAVYKQLRLLLSKYPNAAFLLTFNLRKRDRKNAHRPNLLSDPRSWLEEVSGTLDILNRSDVRLGLDTYEDEIRVLNGIRRGEEMQPLVIRPVEKLGKLAGFALCSPHEVDLLSAFPKKQREHWSNLPNEFRFDDAADKIVPRASLSRLLRSAKRLGLVEEENGTYQKVLC